MAGLCMIIAEKLKPSIRGSLTRWMMEVKTGVFVGTISARVREEIWERVVKSCKMMKNLAAGDAGAILIHQSNTEQGFEMRIHGNYSKTIVDFEGLQLVKTMHDKRRGKRKGLAKSTSKVTGPGTLEVESTALAGDGHAAIPGSMGKAGRQGVAPGVDGNPAPQNGEAASRGANQGEHPWLKEGDVANRWMPAGFIERWAILSPTSGPCSSGSTTHPGKGNNLVFSSGGHSTYHEIPSSKVWEPGYLAEVKGALETCLKAACSLQATGKSAPTCNSRPDKNDTGGRNGQSGVKIACIDIETTTFLPKAYEGFVNVMGIAVLDSRGKNGQEKLPVVAIYQVFNMYRKRPMVPALLQLARPFFEDADVLLVFNKDFDIDILETVIKTDHLDVRFPATIVDLRDRHQSLKALESWLWLMVGFKRHLAPKGDIGEYYAAFKGKGRDGSEKCLEPIGTYNALDAITPLVAHLLHELKAAGKTWGKKPGVKGNTNEAGQGGG